MISNNPSGNSSMPTPSVTLACLFVFPPDHLPRSIKETLGILARRGLEALAVALAPSGPEPVRELPLLQSTPAQSLSVCVWSKLETIS
jgi:hypothetical protein